MEKWKGEPFHFTKALLTGQQLIFIQPVKHDTYDVLVSYYVALIIYYVSHLYLSIQVNV